jgi:hypothetical protein
MIAARSRKFRTESAAAMAFRLRKRIKRFPGLWLNASKSGVSLSAGIPGLTVNGGRGKARVTASVPGAGLSYAATSHAQHVAPAEPAKTRWLFWLLLVLAVAGTTYTLTL